MCQCLSFLVHPTRWASWKRAVVRLFRRIRSYNGPFTGLEVHSYSATGRLTTYSALGRRAEDRPSRQGTNVITLTMGTCMSANSKILSEKRKQEKGKDPAADSEPSKRVKSRRKEARKDPESAAGNENQLPRRICINGASNLACLFTQQGRKGLNQDAMLVWEDFGPHEDTVFCGVFDGHGPHGHLVAQRVRDSLPPKLASNWQAVSCVGNEQVLSEARKELESRSTKGAVSQNCDHKEEDGGSSLEEPKMFSLWKESFLNAYMVMDKELRGRPSLDCFCSGTTAVTLVKQGNDIILGNVGDSRAILGTKSDDDSLIAVQLTVDLKPNLPQEAERIRQCKGRVFALHDEPEVHRVWLPHDNSPGLAMARAFGDFCLKNFGVIAVPEVTYRRLTERDQFIVLATDGIWDVLSNEQVVEIVSSVSARPLAARAVVDIAVRAWRSKYPTSKVDDCAVVCLYVDDIPAVPHDSCSKKQSKDSSSFVKQQISRAVSQNPRLVETGCPAAVGILSKAIGTCPQAVSPNIKDVGGGSQSHCIPVQTEGTSLQVVIQNLRQNGNHSATVLRKIEDTSKTQSSTQAETSHQSPSNVAKPDVNSTQLNSTVQNDNNENDKVVAADPPAIANVEANIDDWTALEGVTRVNSLVTLPRFAPGDMRAGG